MDMRRLISLVEAHDHPHVRGEDEWFSANFGMHEINVDEARRLIASGAVKATPYQMPVKQGGERLLGLSASQFGSRSEDTSDLDTFAGGGVDRGYAMKIPDEHMETPGLILKWNEREGQRAFAPKKPSAWKDIDPGQSYAMLVDGNHRLTKRFLEGDEGTMPFLLVQDWNDIAKFSYVNGKRIADILR